MKNTKRPVEFSGMQFRDKTFAGTEITTPASGFTVAETRSAMESRPGLSKVNDLRLIGCPQEIFSRLIARRAAAAGIVHVKTDAERREEAQRTAALIQNDSKRHAEFVRPYLPENQF